MDFSGVKNWKINNVNVKQVVDGYGRIIWKQASDDYFYVKNLYNGANTLTFNCSSRQTVDVLVSTSGDLTNWDTAVQATSKQINFTTKDQIVYIKATTNKWAVNQNIHLAMSATRSFGIGGNIMSLLYGDQFENQNLTNSNTNAFIGLFKNSTALTDISELTLPSNVVQGCYDSMFMGCSSLQTVPTNLLPATTLAPGCYYNMFSGCGRLTNTPTLNATNLAIDCYCKMFENCTSLTTTPTLSATQMVEGCYHRMFAGCTSLSSTPTLSATSLALRCYKEMFEGCTSITKTCLLPATTLASYCYEGMFKNCTGITYDTTNGPILPAPLMVTGCYMEMFSGCTSLNGIKVYANKIPDTDETCTECWLENVAPTGTFYNQGEAVYEIDCESGIPVGWTENLATPLPFFVENPNNFSINLNIDKISEVSGASVSSITLYKKTNLVDPLVQVGSTSQPQTIQLSSKERVYLYAVSGGSLANSNLQAYHRIFCTNVSTGLDSPLWDMGGDIRSLIYGEDFLVGELPNKSDPNYGNYTYTFAKLFNGASTLRSANRLRLTSSIIEGCYHTTFGGCQQLLAPPVFTVKANTAQTALPNRCFQSMFTACKVMFRTPRLLPKYLGDSCYYQMFKGCLQLHKATSYANDITPTDCIGDWLDEVASVGTLYDFGDAAYIYNTPSGLPQNWLTVTPDTYFYIANTASETGNIKIEWDYLDNTSTLYTSTDKTTWSSVGQIGGATPGSIGINPARKKVYLKSVMPAWGSITDTMGMNINGSAFASGGNPKSLLFADNYKALNLNSSNNAYAFRQLFRNATNLIDVYNIKFNNINAVSHCYDSMFFGCSGLTTPPKKLNNSALDESCYYQMFAGCTKLTFGPELPATTLANSCYNSMFYGCTSLTSAPALPASALAMSCYGYMFAYCSSLTTAPALPATTLAVGCYSYMFQNCTSLTTAPELSATTLAGSCYSGMFSGCTSLTATPALPATTLAVGCYSYMFDGCTSLTTIPTLPATTMYTTCYHGMFCGCTGLTTVSTLPATTLAESCYENMFEGCTSLTTTPYLPVTTLAYSCYSKMFKNCTSLVTATSLPATTLAVSCYNSMFEGCTSLTSAPNLSAGNLVDSCYAAMFSGCISLITPPALPATILAPNCYSYMFQNCGITSSPELPAQTLVESCYSGMFRGCSNLSSIIIRANNNSATNCTNEWVENVAGSGVFYNLGNASYTPDDISGIPIGWTQGTAPDYFYFENLKGTSGTLNITKTHSSAPTITIWKSTDQSNWVSVGNTSTTGLNIVVPAKSKIYLKAQANQWGLAVNNNIYYNTFTTDFDCNIGGTLVSLLYSNESITQLTNKTLLYATTFPGLFAGVNIIDASNLILPNNTTINCYTAMFSGCRKLVYAPQLTAPVLSEYCYSEMFQDCSSLTIAPVLSAEKLEEGCYSQMFKNCVSLTTPPQLTSKYLVNNCYYQMFSGCRNMNYIIVAADELAQDSTTDWLNDVARVGTFHNGGDAKYTKNSSSGIPEGWSENEIETKKYFYVEDVSNSVNTITITNDGGAPSGFTIYKKTENGNWTSVGVSGSTPLQIPLRAKERVYLKATTNKWGNYAWDPGLSYYVGNVISGSGNFKVGGNIKSLLFGDDFQTTHFTSSNTNTFVSLFRNSTNLINAEKLVLWDNNFIPSKCCVEMFRGCNNLTTAPMIISEISGDSSYFGAFTGCTSLATPPKIFNIKVGPYGYIQAFRNCTSLTSTPALPAVVLNNGAYNHMFEGCTSLTTPPALPATTLKYACYQGMFYGCTSLTSAPALPAMVAADSCYRDMFDGCTSLTAAPTLPATTLVNKQCYQGMFKNCTSLTNAPALPATTLVQYCYQYMFEGCTSLTTAPTLSATTLASGCYYGMFKNCTSLTSAPALPATTLANNCYDNMFRGCTTLTTAPVLPATTLVQGCYSYMFYDCTLLNSVTTYAQNISATNCLHDWLGHVAATGNLYNWCETVNYPTGNSGIPSGWTEHKMLYFYIQNEDQEFGNTISFTKEGNPSSLSTLQYSKDKENWIDVEEESLEIPLGPGERAYVTADMDAWALDADNYISIDGTSDFSVGNNIMSLLDGSNLNFETATLAASTNDYAFAKLFVNSIHLISAENLILPLNTSAYCYDNMFKGCTNLTAGPELPATTLTIGCYQQMFMGNNLLAVTPTMPTITVFGDYSCYGMFEGCSSLVDASGLIDAGTVLSTGCCERMFADCTQLRIAPDLAADLLPYECYNEMFMGCQALVELNVAANGYDGTVGDISDCAANILANTAGGTVVNTGQISGSDWATVVPRDWTVINK